MSGLSAKKLDRLIAEYEYCLSAREPMQGDYQRHGSSWLRVYNARLVELIAERDARGSEAS